MSHYIRDPEKKPQRLEVPGRGPRSDYGCQSGKLLGPLERLSGSSELGVGLQRHCWLVLPMAPAQPREASHPGKVLANSRLLSRP